MPLRSNLYVGCMCFCITRRLCIHSKREAEALDDFYNYNIYNYELWGSEHSNYIWEACFTMCYDPVVHPVHTDIPHNAISCSSPPSINFKWHISLERWFRCLTMSRQKTFSTSSQNIISWNKSDFNMILEFWY